MPARDKYGPKGPPAAVTPPLAAARSVVTGTARTVIPGCAGGKSSLRCDREGITTYTIASWAPRFGALRRMAPSVLVFVLATPATSLAVMPSPASVPVPAAGEAAPMLHLGSGGGGVRALEGTLARLSYLPSSAVDGIFGMQTGTRWSR